MCVASLKRDHITPKVLNFFLMNGMRSKNCLQSGEQTIIECRQCNECRAQGPPLSFEVLVGHLKTLAEASLEGSTLTRECLTDICPELDDGSLEQLGSIITAGVFSVDDSLRADYPALFS